MTNALLIENATIITMDPGRRVLDRGHILVENGRIAAIGDGSLAGETRAERIARFANGADVDTTIVGGRVLMRGRRLVGQDEGAILDRALRAFDLAMARAGLSERR